MKRFGLLLSTMLLVFSFSAFAEESVLIDFSQMTPDTSDGENGATLINFSDKVGTGYPEEEKALMKTSLALENWEVLLAPSARTVENMALSMVRPAPVSSTAKRFAGETVMGIRVHFPLGSYNSWAIVKPPFDIPAYIKNENGYQFSGKGVVLNVGVIKSLSMNVFGSNFPNGIGLIMEDHNKVKRTIFVDYLKFDGWKTLTWNNPNYISDVRNREVKRLPLYPKASPMYKLAGIIVYRDAAQEGGDFITYVKDINITYDKAVLNPVRDIDEESLWGILDKREESRRNAEFKKLGEIQVLRYIEQKKMHVDEELEAAAAPAAAAPAETTTP